MSVRVKICGLSTKETVGAAVEAGADYLGFVFYPPSPRNVTPETAFALTQALARPIGTVAVTVNPSHADLKTLFAGFVPGFLQLHGQETPQDVERIRELLAREKLDHVRIIKAIAIRGAADVEAAHAFEPVADILMFDAKPPKGLPGGNGVAFDRALLSGHHFAKPWFLSGGLTPENVAEALHLTGAAMADVSSGVESAPGAKDAAKIKAFIERAKMR
jgi:phosphoribosylanthranilate isomerase